MEPEEWKALLGSRATPLEKYAVNKFNLPRGPKEYKIMNKNAKKALKIFADNLGSIWD